LQDTEKADWIRYVRSLNDRRLNRRTSSGFQAWTILAFTALCFSRVLQLVPRMVEDVQFRSDLLVITSLELYAGAVVLFALLTGPVATVYLDRHQSYHIHAVAPLSAAQDQIRGWGLSAVFFMCMCLAFVTARNTNPHWIPFVFWWLSLMTFYYCANWTVGSHRRATLGKETISTWAFLEQWWWKWLCVLIIVVTAIAWVLAYRSSNVLALERDGVNLLTAGFAFIGVLAGLAVLTFILADSWRDSWLEEFEATVLLEDMSAKTIRDGLVRGYLGQDLTASLEYLTRSADEAAAHCLSAVDAATKGYVYIAMLDPTSADFPSQWDANFKFMDLLPGILANAVQPALNEVGKVSDAIEGFLSTGGAVSTGEMLTQLRSILDTTRETNRQFLDLSQNTLKGMVSDFLVTAANAKREEEARKITEKLPRT